MAISLNLKHKLSVAAIVQCLLHGDAIPGVVIEAGRVYLGMCGELPRPFQRAAVFQIGGNAWCPVIGFTSCNCLDFLLW